MTSEKKTRTRTDAKKGKAAPVRRPRGRPARLSREGILEKATQLLQENPVEALTMTRVAETMGTVTMSLYNYFPNREALLNAVAEHVFEQFEPPLIEGDWRQSLMNWLLAMQDYLEQHPSVMRVIGWEGRVSGAWVRVMEPVVRILREQGLEGRDLAFTFNWFMSSAMGLLMLETSQPASRQQMSLGALDILDEAGRQNVLAMLPYSAEIDHHDVLAFAFERLLDGVDRLLKKSK